MKIKSLLTGCGSAIALLILFAPLAIAQQLGGPGPEDAADDEPIIVRPNQDRGPARPFQLPPDREALPDQTTILNAKFAGWEEVGKGTKKDRVSKDLRANWIMVDSNGRFAGRVTPVEGAEVDGMVIYLMNMGRLVKDTTVDAEGKFEFSNVREGSYSLVGWGSKAFFAFGLNILDYNEDSEVKIWDTVEVLAFQNETTINLDWIRFFAPRVNFRVYGSYPAGEGEEDPASLYGVKGLAKYPPKATPATSISSHRVTRTASGGIVGRIHQMTSETGRPVDVRSTKVMLLRGDDVVAAAETDNYGIFQFPQVAEGQYGLAAVGVDGMGAIGIDVGAASPMNDMGELAEKSSDEPFDFTLVSSETVGWMNHYATELAYRRNLLAPRRPSPDERKQTCSTCNGNGCNACGGSGQIVTSRCQSFEDWAANNLAQHQRTKFGTGYILSEASKDLRRGVQRTNNLFENAFYGATNGSSNFGGTGNLSNNGFQNGGYDQNNFQGGGYNQPAPTPAMNGPQQ